MTTNIQISRAASSEVNSLFRAFWEPSGIMPALMDQDRVRQCDVFFVAEIDGEVTGVVALASKGCDGSKRPTLATLYTVRQYLKKGIGRCLCEHGIRHFVDADLTPIFCDVTTRGMHVTVLRLAPELQKHLQLSLSYEIYGDEWERYQRLPD
jgi:N-acetylglutamate synthase-like GNAT family acetyltransferase